MTPGAARTVAALDLGTNTFLMLVALERAGGGIEVVEDLCRTPRLGAGLARSGRIDAEARARGLAVLAEFRARVAQLGIDPSDVRAVGTAVFRRAANAREFIDAARRESGFEIAVLAEQDEARLGWLAAIADGADARSRLVDVGGGSTEVVADGGATRVSAPVGAVVLTEAWQGDFGGRPFEEAAWHGLLDDVRREVAALVRVADGGAGPVVALGGTGLNLACLELGLEAFAPAPVEGVRMRAARAREWSERLRRLPLRERLALPLERDRAAILPAGLACLAGALTALGAEEFSVTGRGLRFGVARELVAGSPRRAPGR